MIFIKDVLSFFHNLTDTFLCSFAIIYWKERSPFFPAFTLFLFIVIIKIQIPRIWKAGDEYAHK